MCRSGRTTAGICRTRVRGLLGWRCSMRDARNAGLAATAIAVLFQLLSAASALAPDQVGLTFLGHASFLIESPGGARIVTDYNGFNRPRVPPDIVTMNNAHPTHFTDHIEPGIKHV